jgi:hypothetical protein
MRTRDQLSNESDEMLASHESELRLALDALMHLKLSKDILETRFREARMESDDAAVNHSSG